MVSKQLLEKEIINTFVIQTFSTLYSDPFVATAEPQGSPILCSRGLVNSCCMAVFLSAKLNERIPRHGSPDDNPPPPIKLMYETLIEIVKICCTKLIYTS